MNLSKGAYRPSTVKYFLSVFLLALFLTPLVSVPTASADVEVTLELDRNEEPDVIGFKVYSRLEGKAYDYTNPVWVGSTNSCVITGLQANTNYYFTARSFDSLGNESPDSNEVFLDLTSEAPLEKSHWQVFRDSDNLCVFDAVRYDGITVLDLPRLILDENTSYYWTVQFINAEGDISDWSIPSYLTTPGRTDDQNGNGIPDYQEAEEETDYNDDGILDNEQIQIQCVRAALGNGQLCLEIFDGGGIDSIENVEAVDPVTLPIPSPETYQMPLGLIGFKVLTPQIGDIVSVNVYLSEAATTQDQWVTCDRINEWQTYGDSAQFDDDRTMVQLEIEDGGFGDIDGIANGIIVHQSGFGSLDNTRSANPGDGGGGPLDTIASDVQNCFIGSGMAAAQAETTAQITKVRFLLPFFLISLGAALMRHRNR
jgi:hypothetical protein